MSPDRRLKSCFITFILLISSLSIFVIIPENIKAEPGSSTPLYFTDYYGLFDVYEDEFEDNYEDSLFPSMSLTPPTKDNDSELPPKLLSNSEAAAEWYLTWVFYQEIKAELEGYNESEYDGLEDFGLLELYNPFKIIESYRHEGKETLEINGDIVFNLYFSSNFGSKLFKDYVKVSISSENLLGFPVEIQNTTGQIKSDILGDKIQKTVITIEDIDYDLEPGETLLFSLELIPTEKPLGKIIKLQDKDQIIETFGLIADALANQTILSGLNEIGIAIKEILNNSDLYNFSLEDLAEIGNILRTSCFLYDSVSHPSSVMVPAEITTEDDNVRIYYLHEEGLMDEELPEDRAKPLELKISSEAGTWAGPELERSKILTKATASLYIDHQDLRRIINLLKGKIQVNAILLDGETEIATASNELNRNTLLGLLQKPSEPMMFTFNNFEPYEIEYGKSLSLQVAASQGSTLKILGFRRNAKLLYDSTQYPSSLTVEFEETDHIKMDVAADPSNEEVALGGSITYTLNITSDFEEEIDITVYGFSKSEEDKWNIELPESFTIDKDGEATKTIVVTSTDDDLDAYDNEDFLDATFAVEGKTGKDTYLAEILISENAVEYGIKVVVPPGKNIKHGKNDTYYIKIKNNNTGYFPDSYTIEAVSENDWNLSVDYKKEDVSYGKEIEFKVKVFVPEYTDLETDVLTVTILSDESEAHGKEKSMTINITTTVISPNILELIYRFFETTAEDLGLDDVLGSYAPHFLAAIIFIIIFFIAILLIFFFTIKYVNIVCLERIKEITPEEEAKFEITIQNPYKRTLSYEIHAQETSSSKGWKVCLDTEKIILNPKESKAVFLTVKPTRFVKQDDWAEVKIEAKPLDKSKMAEISVVATIKDAKPEIHIVGVFHWPKFFKKGDRIVTSFRVENRGNASADNVDVILYVKGEEKNKVESITIPRDGYAEVKMPWIAVRGKNEINIVVK